jgi:ATP-dependent Lhr-like helicase
MKRALPDRAAPDHALPDRAAPDRALPDRAAPDRLRSPRFVRRVAAQRAARRMARAARVVGWARGAECGVG